VDVDPEAAVRYDDADSATTDPSRADDTKTEGRNSSAAWKAGSVIAGKYEILCCLGSGGFGNVYKVRHTVRKKCYALKTPHPDLARDEVFQLRFEREIEAMERFVHPDAVTIRDSGITESGQPYYTMDFVDGESLKTVLEREGRLEPGRAVLLAEHILCVLKVAHEHQILHRDIKPDNFLLTWTGGQEKVKVLDFGVAKLLDLVGGSRSISGGERVGTPRYMSPEQILGDPLGLSSDIFSLGIVFYEMITGQHPFGGADDLIRVTGGILNRPAVPPATVVPAISSSLSDIVLHMLEKDAGQRPQSAAKVLERLAGLRPTVAPMQLAARAPKLLSECPRKAVKTLVLRQNTPSGQRRTFLFFQSRVDFGRSGGAGSSGHGRLVLRRLPCRSEALDPDNWRLNLTISNFLGTIHPDGSSLVVEVSRDAKGGLSIGGVRCQRDVRIQSDPFHLTLGEKALELDGLRLARRSEEIFDPSFLVPGRPAGAEASPLIGYSNPNCRVDSVRLRRAANWPLHEYHLVYRVVRIGAAAGEGIRLPGNGVAALHAAVLFEDGEAFLTAFEEGVRFSYRGGDGENAGVFAPRELAPHELLPMIPGLICTVGDCEVLVDGVDEADFKSV